ncbi:hypothetical protein AB434_0174 [Heyndrickxia coagulans]|uniref:Uncharacterized protein n=1 Tax=Heyndrickxia coagulans TaxID=1398 RepID=A0AAN0T3S3_HEYCO|nr:hypothetical protein SB48_HM08orf01542 [Heyndrickxia coagulans]AKN52579.1 hypothetical protein AB434_0174 [Heyndrickxia coagulans]
MRGAKPFVDHVYDPAAILLKADADEILYFSSNHLRIAGFSQEIKIFAVL